MPSKRQKASKQLKLNSKPQAYSLFGFKKDEPDVTGWLTDQFTISEDSNDAKPFYSENVQNLSGYGTPQQWLQLINDDSALNHGYKFHLVRTLNKA